MWAKCESATPRTPTSCNGVQAPVSAKPSIMTRHTRMRECNGLQLDADMSDTLAAVKMRCDVSFFAAMEESTLSTLCLRRPCLRKEEERCGDGDVVWVRETRVIAAADGGIASHQQPC